MSSIVKKLVHLYRDVGVLKTFSGIRVTDCTPLDVKAGHLESVSIELIECTNSSFC